MQKVTQAVLQYRDFRKKATEQDFHLLNQQGEPAQETPVIVVP
jgi:hypothetical protein